MDKRVNNLSLLSDAELAAEANENPQFFNELLRRYNKSVFGFFLTKVHDTFIAEELQERTLIKAWNALRTGHYSERKKFGKWLGIIARNVWVDYVRKPRGYHLELEAAYGIAEESAMSREEKRKRLGMALRRLGRQFRLILILISIKKKSYREAAKRMHISVQTAYQYYFAARAEIKHYLF